jgi:hypothetical protein
MCVKWSEVNYVCQVKSGKKCDSSKVCQWLATCQLFSPSTLGFFQQYHRR